jgi:hypothetical protein
MAQTRTLWRIIGHSLHAPERWQAGLRMHMQYGSLTSVAIQIGSQSRCYVALIGCGACLHAACRPGCHVVLLRRLVQACYQDGQLLAVALPQGFAPRPYRHAALIWPTRHAQRLGPDAALTTEQRVLLHWQRVGSQLRVSGLMATATPIQVDHFTQQGWHCWPVPAQLQARLLQPMPIQLPWGARWDAAPDLFVEQPSHAPVPV